MRKVYLTVCCILLSGFYLFAQDSTKNTQSWHLSAGLGFVPVPTYHIVGTDTGFSNSMSVAPSVSLSHKSGFAISYSPKMVLGGSNPGLFMHAVSAGFSKYGQGSFDFAATYAHYFFTGNSSVPYSPLTNEIYTELSYTKAWLRPLVVAGIGFGTNTAVTSSPSVYDIGLAAGVSHSFDWDKGDMSYSIAPALLLNAGTNEYFSFLSTTKYIGHNNKFVSYIKKGAGANRGRGSGGSGGGGGTTTTTTTTTTVETFNLVNTELRLESSVDFGSLFTIHPVASFFIPVGNAAGSGLGTYWQVAFNYKF